MIVPNRVKEASYVRNIFSATPEQGTPIATVVKSDYWAHATRLFHVLDHIEVVPEDGAYYVELLVTHVGKNFVRVVELRRTVLEEPFTTDEPTDSAYTLGHRGAIKLWCVMRKSDKQIIHEGSLTKKEAIQWLNEFELTSR